MKTIINLDDLVKVQNKAEKFIFGLSYDEGVTPSFETFNYFEVIQDRLTLRYSYSILEESKLEDIYFKFKNFISSNGYSPKLVENEDDIYEVDSLTSAMTLGELFARFELVHRLLKELVEINTRLEDL